MNFHTSFAIMVTGISDLPVVLYERLLEDESAHLFAEESVNQLNKKYGL